MASKTTTIQIRVDEKLKSDAKKILDQLHINMSEAITIFLSQVVYHNSLPFELRIPGKNNMKSDGNREDLMNLSTAEMLLEEEENI